MKKVLAFAAFALIFASCSNVAKFKPQIEALSTTWDGATSQVTELANSVKTEQSNWMNAVTTMTVAPEAMAKWDDAAKAKFAEIQTAAQNSTTGMNGISTEIDAFITSWTEKSAKLQTLKDGLAAGKLEGDVAAQVAELTASATDATTKVGEWKTKFDAVKTAAGQAQQMFADFMTTAGAATATTGKK